MFELQDDLPSPACLPRIPMSVFALTTQRTEMLPCRAIAECLRQRCNLETVPELLPCHDLRHRMTRLDAPLRAHGDYLAARSDSARVSVRTATVLVALRE